MLYETKSGYFLNISKINFIKKLDNDTYCILFTGAKGSYNIKLEPKEFADIVNAKEN